MSSREGPSDGAAGPVTHRFVVRGHVQGVYFRASTKDKAIALGLVGFAQNLANGDVVVVATGELAALAILERWLHQGSPLARVTSVIREPINHQAHTGFRVL